MKPKQYYLEPYQNLGTKQEHEKLISKEYFVMKQITRSKMRTCWLMETTLHNPPVKCYRSGNIRVRVER